MSGPPGRSRCQLALHRLDAFAAHCEVKGWARAPTKGDYEVLRMTKAGNEPLIVHATSNATLANKRGDCGHGTTWGASARLLQSWFTTQKNNAAIARAIGDES